MDDQVSFLYLLALSEHNILDNYSYSGSTE